MTTVLLGSNSFVDCQTLVAFGQHQLLSVATDPLRVTLSTPPDLPSGRAVHVLENEKGPASSTHARLVTSDNSVAIFWDSVPLLIAILLDSANKTVSLRLDLRPLGIGLFDDSSALHIGMNHFSGNRITGSSAAIVLG